MHTESMVDKSLILQHEARTAFDIGWDFARMGLELRLFEDSDGLFKPIVDGYRDGVAKYGKRHPQYPNGAQRFVIKWLHLRMNAYRRGRTFSEDLTWEYLQSIDDTHCPITRKPFTYGENLDTDWTIDRINNHGGYSKGNVVGLSRVANYSKGTQKVRSCINAAMLAAKSEDGLYRRLSETEWMRVASLISPNESVTNPEVGLLPLACVPKKIVITTIPLQQLQLYSGCCFKGVGAFPSYWTDAFKVIGRHNLYKKACTFAAYAHGATKLQLKNTHSMRWAIEDAWLNKSVIQSWLSLAEAMNEAEAASVVRRFEKLANLTAIAGEALSVDSWHIDSYGFVIPGSTG